MERQSAAGTEQGFEEVVIVSDDRAFAERMRSAATNRKPKPTVAVFEEPLAAVLHLLESFPCAVVYDVDNGGRERNYAVLRAIRLICRRVPIIVCASRHSELPFEPDNVGVFYRVVKSAPDLELRTAIESARVSIHRRDTS